MREDPGCFAVLGNSSGDPLARGDAKRQKAVSTFIAYPIKVYASTGI